MWGLSILKFTRKGAMFFYELIKIARKGAKTQSSSGKQTNKVQKVIQMCF